MKVYKLRNPLENFAKLLIPILFEINEENEIEYKNECAKKFIDKAVKALDDEFVSNKAKHNNEKGEWILNYEEPISFDLNTYLKLPYISVAIDAGIEIEGDIVSHGMIEFNIDIRGMLVSVGYEALA
jgi:hypothetical protein